MKSAVSSYAFINAKLRGRISRIVPRETLMQMVLARSLEEAVRVLERTSYAPAVQVYTETGDILLTELEIERTNRSGLEDMRRYVTQFGRSDVAEFVVTLLMRFEIWAVKSALRLWFEHRVRGRSIEDKISYLLRSEGSDTEAIVNASDADRIVTLLEDRPFGPVIKSKIDSVADSRSLFDLEIALDRWYYRALIDASAQLSGRDAPIARRLIGMEIDTINVNWVVRLRLFYSGDSARRVDGSQLLPGGSIVDRKTLDAAMAAHDPAAPLAGAISTRIGVFATGEESGDHEDSSMRSLAFLESLLQQMLLVESRRILGGYPFTIGVILAYFVLSRQEARSITTVLNGKNYQLSPDYIGGLL